MNDLYEWLEQQNGGIRTYAEFHQMAYEMARENPDQAAILALVGGVAARFAARFRGEPFSVDQASSAIQEFKEVLQRAKVAISGSEGERLNFANSIATFDLLAVKMH
ncbi:hypothetical protein SAMN05216456_0296 [Devosia crocina]|uniref:Uncharacterized protein n=1 Tax=Devosia crocina TaxID=429728 RepID=A0A1I7MYN3_9HYPH|nr:hypothetical protein [Devosia crocina]SFV27512.1 hypothetical protein SAMN05216456_0296 [Devosia crocina]